MYSLTTMNMDELPGAAGVPPVADPVAPEPPAPAADPFIAAPVSFTGTGGEYFKIWIVNLALTIVTLGVYSAWAKVRRLQYFYRHTRLAGTGFDYHGDPIAILKGRIVGLVLFGLYSVIGYVNIWLAVGIVIGLAVVMPWLLARSLRFRFHNSSYRGLRFRFHGTTGQAYWIFLAFPVFTVLSLFTLGPLWHHRLKRYQFSNASYGSARFSFNAAVGEFYITYILAVFTFFCLIALLVVGLFGTGVLVALASGPIAEDRVSLGMILFMVTAGTLYAAVLLGVQSITASRIHNECWNTAKTDHHRFASELAAWRLFGIQYTNFLATVATLGLFRPFAQVRLARYYTSTLTVFGSASFESYAAVDADDVTAVGEETADLFDFDIAF
jgi:uncharacterized membrane protein YjgN (DUF898 family)